MNEPTKECRCYKTIHGMGHDPICDCPCHPSQEKPAEEEGWEKRFDKMFRANNTPRFDVVQDTTKMKSFIRSLLSVQKQSIVEEIEKEKNRAIMLEDEYSNHKSAVGAVNALNYVLTFIRGLK